MVKRALLYQYELEKCILNMIDDFKFMYYYSAPFPAIEGLMPKYDNICNQNAFVSVDNNNEVIGMITYDFSVSDLATYNWRIVCFKDKPNIVFARDVLKVIDDVFCKYNFNKMEFSAISGNPILKSYRKFIKKYDGVEVGCRRQHCKLMDQQLHDIYYFDVFAEGYKRRKNGDNNK